MKQSTNHFCLAFTGTQEGMTYGQEEAVRTWLRAFKRKHDSVLGLHGVCIGAVATFDVLCHELDIETVCRPCNLANKRAFVGFPIAKPKHPLSRNQDIVHQANGLIATPKGFAEELRSGTWATIRYARKDRKPIRIFWPDGTSTRDHYR